VVKSSASSAKHAKPSSKKSSASSPSTKAEEEATAITELTSLDVKTLMATAGPVVSCVLLKADGTITNLKEVDMTPKLRSVQKLLGGEVTFLGQWAHEPEVEGVILITLKTEVKKSKKNKHELQPPFRGVEVKGDIFLMRTDEEGVPVDFTVEEYEAFAKRTDVGDVDIPEDDEEEEEEDEDEDDDDEEDDDEEGDEDDDEEDEEDEEEGGANEMVEQLVQMVTAQFKGREGRDPTAEESAGFRTAVMNKLGLPEDGDEDDEDEELDTIEEGDEDEEEEEEEVEMKPPSKKGRR
jgi:hypothetical protein